MKKTFLCLALVALFNLIPTPSSQALACDKEDRHILNPIEVLTLEKDTTVCLDKGNVYRIVSIDGMFFIDTPKIVTNNDIKLTLEKGVWIVAEKKWLNELSL